MLKVRKPLTHVPYEKLPKRKQEFIKAYVKCGNAMEAFKQSGYAITKNAVKRASEFKIELAPYIEAKIKEYATSVELTAVALYHLRELAENAESEAVKLGAVKEILSRTLPEETHREVTINHNVTNLTDDEIDKRIAQLSREVNGSVIDVVPNGQARISGPA